MNFSCFARLDRLPDLEQKWLVVVSSLGLRIRTRVTRVVVKARGLLYESVRPLPLVAGFLKDLTRSRGQLIAENALLRQQLIVASRKVKRPLFKDSERGLLVLLSRIVHGWQNAVLLVKPETILRWHREGFRLFWRWKSRARDGRPSLDGNLVALIRQMWQANPTWGSPRIQAELAKLGIEISDSTIRKYRPEHRRSTSAQTWKTFLHNHTNRNFMAPKRLSSFFAFQVA